MLPASDGWERFHPLTPLLSAGRLVAIGLFLATQQLPALVEDRIVLVSVGVGLALCATAGAYSYFAWQFAGFRLIGDRLEIRKGILFKNRGNVPIARIESVDVAQKAIPRLLGLAEVIVEVASQTGGEGELKYLSVAGADELRTRLEGARRGLVESTDTEPDERPPRQPIAQVTDRDLLVAYGAGPIAVAVVALLVFVGVFIARGVQGLLTAGVFTIIGLAATVATQLRRIDRLAGFRLSRDADELHVERGFVEKLTQQIPLARIQAIRIEEPWLWRKFGRAKLLVSVAGYRGSADARAAATAILMPIAPRVEIDRLVTSLGGPMTELLVMRTPPRRARWRSPILWRHIGVGHAPGFTVTQRGWLRRRIDLVTSDKLQSLRLTDGPWQRRLGLATLHLDTAGPGIAVSAPHLEAGEALDELWIARRATTVETGVSASG